MIDEIKEIEKLLDKEIKEDSEPNYQQYIQLCQGGAFRNENQRFC